MIFILLLSPSMGLVLIRQSYQAGMPLRLAARVSTTEIMDLIPVDHALCSQLSKNTAACPLVGWDQSYRRVP